MGNYFVIVIFAQVELCNRLSQWLNHKKNIELMSFLD